MATLVRWDPFREIAALQNDMSRFMGAFREGGNGATQDRTWVPALDVWETENDIPEEKVSVEFENGALTVSAERERSSDVKQDGFYRYERRFGSFARSISLPEGVTEDGIKASFADGVLEVRVRKPEEAKPRRIEIGVNGEKTIEGTATEA
jgi:HSP20 family protein